MAGKSAHGRGGKIPYYEHSWQAKQQAALKERRPKCDPFRILAKKIEPSVWQDVKLFLTREEFVREILESAKAAKPDEGGRERELMRFQDRSERIARQIEVLAERIARLPASLDPQALYTQLEQLQKELASGGGLRARQRILRCRPTSDPPLGRIVRGYALRIRSLHRLTDSRNDKSPAPFREPGFCHF